MDKKYGLPAFETFCLEGNAEKFTVRWKEKTISFELSYDGTNLFIYKDREMLYINPKKYEQYKKDMVLEVLVGEEGLFPKLKEINLGAATYDPLTKLANDLGIESCLSNSGPDYYFGALNRLFTEQEVKETFESLVKEMTKKEQLAREKGETVNWIGIKDERRRSALFEAKRRLGPTDSEE